MNFEVYSYWNLSELQGLFNAVAALTSSGDYVGLLRLLALIAIIAVVLAVLAGRSRQEDFWRWVIMLAIMNGLLIVPKSNVILVDRTGSQPTVVVSNVPIGLAVLAHGTSKIGDWLTRAYETIFSLPNDLQFQKNGLMFGHAVLEETQFMNPDSVSGNWSKDFQEFWRECVTPEIVSNNISADTIRKATDLWGAISNVNPARFVTLSTVGTVSCTSAYNDLGQRLTNNIVPALLSRYGAMKYGNDPQAPTKAKNAITSAYAWGPGVPGSAEAIVKQAAAQQAAINAYCNVFAQAGDSNRAALCYSASMGAYQTNHTYQVLAKIAESSMPKIHSAVVLIQYAVAPIILAFAIVAAHLALPVLRAYVMSLVWIQLWPPLYAVVHYIMTMKMQGYAAALGSMAGTLEGSSPLVNMAISDQAIAGMLTIAIPAIAAALVKGGEVGLQAVAGLVSAPRTAEKQAFETAKGNENVGHWDTAPSVRTGSFVRSHFGDSGVTETTFSDGTIVWDGKALHPNMNLRLGLSNQVTAGLQKKSEAAIESAFGHVVTAGQEMAAAFGQVAEFLRHHGKDSTLGTVFSKDDRANITKSFNEAQEAAHSFEKQLGLKEGMGAKILGELSAGGGLELFGNGFKAQLRAQGISEATLNDEKKMADAFKLAKTYQNAMQRIHEVSKQSKFDTGESSGAKAMRGIRASLDNAQKHSDMASASYRQSLALSEAATRARNNAGSWEAGFERQFLEWMTTQRNEQDLYGRNFSASDVVVMAEKNPELLAPFVERFVKERLEPMLAEGAGKMLSEFDLKSDHDSMVRNLEERRAQVIQFGSQNIDNVTDAARQQGIDPDSNVNGRRLESEVNRTLNNVGHNVKKGSQAVNKEGSGVQSVVVKGVEQSKQSGSLFKTAAGNASVVVLPQGTENLLYRHDLLPGSFAQEYAQNYKGSETDAWLDTFIFGASLFAGGGAGRVLGAGVGRILGSKAGEAAAREILAENAATAVGAGARDGMKLGVGAGVVVGKNLADGRHHDQGAALPPAPDPRGAGGSLTAGQSVMDRAWNQGEQVARQMFSSAPQQPVTPPPTAHTEAGRPFGGDHAQPAHPMSGRAPSGDHTPSAALPPAPDPRGAGGMGGAFGNVRSQYTFDSPPGPSWGNLFGGARRPAPVQVQQTHQGASQNAGQKKGDVPPPSGR